MNNTAKKRIRIFLLILIIVLLFFIFLFFFNKDFRFNVAVRFIVLTNVDPFCERLYISKEIYTDHEEGIWLKIYERNKRFERLKKSLQTSLKINEEIYKIQCSDLWCDNKRAVYIDSDTYVGGGLTDLSVGTGHGSYETSTVS